MWPPYHPIVQIQQNTTLAPVFFTRNRWTSSLSSHRWKPTSMCFTEFDALCISASLCALPAVKSGMFHRGKICHSWLDKRNRKDPGEERGLLMCALTTESFMLPLLGAIGMEKTSHSPDLGDSSAATLLPNTYSWNCLLLDSECESDKFSSCSPREKEKSPPPPTLYWIRARRMDRKLHIFTWEISERSPEGWRMSRKNRKVW